MVTAAVTISMENSIPSYKKEGDTRCLEKIEDSNATNKNDEDTASWKAFSDDLRFGSMGTLS